MEAAGGGGAMALPGNPQLPESLAAVCSLLAHRKFACLFVDRGGVRALLALPKVGRSKLKPVLKAPGCSA